MTRPTDKEEMNRIIEERPGDAVYARIRKYLPFIKRNSEKFTKSIVTLILSDLIHDLALSSALDDIGCILEYQSQDQGIEKPKFDGQPLMKDAQKISKLRFVVGYAKLLGFDQDQIDQVMKAEIEKQWGIEPNRKSKPPAQVMKVPDSFFNAVRTASEKIYESEPKRTRKKTKGNNE